MNRFCLFACCMLLTVGLNGQDFSLFAKKSFQAKDGGTLPYRILLPENYDATKQYPLVLFLHGAGERGDDNEKQLVHGVKTFLQAEHREQFPCILIAPQCPKDSYWASPKFERTKYPIDFDFNYEYDETVALDRAIQLTRSIIKQLSVDKKRVYITGLSMGGMGTYEAVYRYRKLFAAAVAVCGGADVAAYKKKHAKIPFWLFHGDVDGVVEVKHSRAMKDKLEELGAEVRYTEYAGVNHNSWEKAYEESELLPWLFAKSR
ncbi:MAG: prolyl oligopeptidase family serine peptidase [Saprospiraceae bacterium]|nr:prolyl oligopeptidase family serine peptidase [Saprospiraceae bacterium]